MIHSLAALVVVGLGIGWFVAPDALLDESQPCLEFLFQLARIEDEVADLLPEIALILAANNADGPLEHLATQPKLAIERHIGQAGNEPIGCMKNVPQPRPEDLAVP